MPLKNTEREKIALDPISIFKKLVYIVLVFCQKILKIIEFVDVPQYESIYFIFVLAHKNAHKNIKRVKSWLEVKNKLCGMVLY